MKNKQLLIIASFLLLLLPNVILSQPLNAPNLGLSAKFALFTAVGAVTCAGTSVVTGNIGTNSGALTGFPPGVIHYGQAHVQDLVTLQAANDVIAAYSYLQNMTCTVVLGTTLGNNQILTPGIYCTGAASTLNGNLTFDAQGNPDALFVIQMDGAFATSTFSSVSLINGASFCNIYWQVNGAFTLGDFSLFRGTIVTNGAITLLQGATILGRGLSKVGAIATSNVIATMPIPFIMNIKSNRDYLYTNESANFTTTIKCGCPTNNVVPIVTIPSGLTHQSGGTFAIDKVTFPATTFAEGQTIDFNFQAMLNNTVTTPINLFYDGVEGAALFTASTLAGTMPTFSLNTLTPPFETRSWAVGDSLLPSDVALTLSSAITIPAFGNYSLHFNHQFLSDTLDGGVVEFSIDGGTSWIDAGSLFLQNGYNDTLNFITDNALINREVFTRTSNGKRESIIDVSPFVGQNLLFRFRFATGTGNGASAGLPGWNIDRIWLANTEPCLPLLADATTNTISQITATMCQNISGAIGLSFALTVPATIKSCTALVNYPNATTINNEGLVSITYSHLSGTIFPNGTTTVTVNALDAGGNTATSSFDVIVNDAIPSINNLPVSVPDSIIVCSNVAVTLSAPVLADEYLWYKNGIPLDYQIAPNNTFMVAAGGGASTNIYTVVVVHPGMLCVSAQSSPVTVIKISPSATISLNGLSTFCANTPTLLTAPAGMANYIWKRGNTIVQTGLSASYLPIIGGNHNVTVIDSNTCTKTSAWVGLTIKSLPKAYTGVDKSICEGSSVQIGDISNVGNTYTWTPSTGLSDAFIANPIATVAGSISYILTVNNSISNCSNTDTLNLSALISPPMPSLSSTTTPICQGSNIMISPISIDATSINWYKNGLSIYNKPTTFALNVINPTAVADLYSIKSKGANNCLSNSSNILNVWVKEATIPTISSTPASIGTNITICVPNGITGNAFLTANSTTAQPTYLWKQGANYIVGANTNTYTAVVTLTQNNKVFSVEATYPNGCIKTSAAKMVKLVTSGCVPKLSAGKDDESLSTINETLSINTYPNPTNDVLNIEVLNSNSNQGKLLLYNGLGQMVLEKNIILIDKIANEQFDMSHLASGIYSLIFQSNEIQYITKIVKE